MVVDCASLLALFCLQYVAQVVLACQCLMLKNVRVVSESISAIHCGFSERQYANLQQQQHSCSAQA